jgi:hypothetical protein
VFRELEVVVFPGMEKAHVRRDDYLELVEASTYGEDRVRVTSRSASYNGSGASR